MFRINIQEAKIHFSKYLKQLQKGEKITLCHHNKPIAEIVPLPEGRPLGSAQGKIKVTSSFFKPLLKGLEHLSSQKPKP